MHIMTGKGDQPVILVTGSGGQLGSELRRLSDQYPGNNFLFATRAELPLNDPGAIEAFFSRHSVEACINCAAYTAVDRAESEPESAYAINADGPGLLAAHCHAQGARFIHISTDYVYDGSIHRPLKETDAVGPVNTYGASKLRGEEEALRRHPGALIIRTSWVYSSFGNNFVKTMLRLFSERDRINVVNDQVGSPTSAADLAGVILEFHASIRAGGTISGVFNYCNTGITTWYDFAVAIRDYVHSGCVISPVPTAQYPTPAKRPAYSVLDTSKIASLLKDPIPSWQESLHKCLDRLTALRSA